MQLYLCKITVKHISNYAAERCNSAAFAAAVVKMGLVFSFSVNEFLM